MLSLNPVLWRPTSCAGLLNRSVPQTRAWCPHTSKHSLPLVTTHWSCCWWKAESVCWSCWKVLSHLLSPQCCCVDPFLSFHTPYLLVLGLQMFQVHEPNSQQLSSCAFSSHSWVQKGCFLLCKKSVAGNARNVFSLSSLLICVFLSCPASLQRPYKDSHRFYRKRRNCAFGSHPWDVPDCVDMPCFSPLCQTPTPTHIATWLCSSGITTPTLGDCDLLYTSTTNPISPCIK